MVHVMRFQSLSYDYTWAKPISSSAQLHAHHQRSRCASRATWIHRALAFACAVSDSDLACREFHLFMQVLKKMGKRIRRRFKKVIKTVTKIIFCRDCSTQVIPIDDNQTDTNPKMKVIH